MQDCCSGTSNGDHPWKYVDKFVSMHSVNFSKLLKLKQLQLNSCCIQNALFVCTVADVITAGWALLFDPTQSSPLFFFFYALSLPVEHRPWTTRLHPALSCAASSVFLQLYLKPAVHISFWSSRLHVFFGRPLPLWPRAVHCSACLAMLSPLFWACDQVSSTFFSSAEPTLVPDRSSSIVPCWIFCLASGCLRFFLDIYSQKLAACRLS